MLFHALVLCLAALVSASPPAGRYVLELPAPCGEACRAELRSELREQTGETCAFAARTATIGTKAFLFLDCTRPSLSAMSFEEGRPVEAMSLDKGGMGGVVGKTMDGGGRRIRVVEDTRLHAFSVVRVTEKEAKVARLEELEEEVGKLEIELGVGGDEEGVEMAVGKNDGSVEVATAVEGTTSVGEEDGKEAASRGDDGAGDEEEEAVPGGVEQLKVETDNPTEDVKAPLKKMPTPWGADGVDGKKDGASCSPDRSQLGKEVNVYILDGGCTPSVDVGMCETTVQDGDDAKNCLDLEGHGNHVAGTVGGRDVGVAPKCTVHCIKVLDSKGTGKTSEVIGGIAKATDHFQKSRNAGGVLNLSLGGLVDGNSGVLESAVRAAAETGLFITLAAGNDDLNACGISPARTADGNKSAGRIFTVESHDNRHNPSGFSNWGECTTISGPGEKILSKTDHGNFGYYSGTSQAAPHVAGAIAILLSDGRNVTIDNLTDGDFSQKNGFKTPILEISC